jgi:hypothetical protein
MPPATLAVAPWPVHHGLLPRLHDPLRRHHPGDRDLDRRGSRPRWPLRSEGDRLGARDLVHELSRKRLRDLALDARLCYRLGQPTSAGPTSCGRTSRSSRSPPRARRAESARLRRRRRALSSARAGRLGRGTTARSAGAWRGSGSRSAGRTAVRVRVWARNSLGDRYGDDEIGERALRGGCCLSKEPVRFRLGTAGRFDSRTRLPFCGTRLGPSSIRVRARRGPAGPEREVPVAALPPDLSVA